MTNSNDPAKVKDILKKLKPRKTFGNLTIRRVGCRAWERPKYIAVSQKLFEIYDIPDPWDPSKKSSKWSHKMGPVSLRLGENRRQPAPHLRPKQTAKKSQVNPANKFRPSGIPSAKPKTKAPAPPPIKRQSQPAKKIASEFGSKSKHKLTRLPVRPDLENPQENQSVSSHNRRLQGRSSGRPTIPVQQNKSKQTNHSGAELESRRPPRITNEKKSSSRGGRMVMKRTIARSPKISKIQPVHSEPTQVTEQPPPVVQQPSPPAPVAPKSANSMSLDDLFGVPTDGEKRIRFNRPKRKK